jgi:PhzF family phenazine biosynthesis protein
MQLVAREMNLSETAFLNPSGSDPGGFDLRWFAPLAEVDLCGHATLATAHLLWESGRISPATVARFHTKSGVLTARRHAEWIELDFPATPDEETTAPPGLVEALGVTPMYVGRSRFDYLIEVDGEDVVRDLRPDFATIASLPVRGVMVTSEARTPGVDFVSRFFGPSVGITEDPATGSAHCCLGPYWSRRVGKNEFVARQLSERGGELRVACAGDRVRLGGQAVTVMRGELVT